ncbi:unnamed protein product [Trichobilharzia szidati]|nr:unnamed protein product [Trichobilharzia szidati]
MGSSFSNLDKSWGCTGFGTSNKNHRKELSGFCRCPKKCPAGYTVSSPSRTKTSTLPVNEPSTPVITNLASVNAYNCTCKSSLVHHHINSDTYPPNSDSGRQSHCFDSQGFISRNSNVPARVTHPYSFANQEQIHVDLPNRLNESEKCNNNTAAKKKDLFTSLSMSTDYAIKQFRNLISSWSCNELCCLYLEYEALYELQLLWKEAIKTRSRAPTLMDDLHALAQNGWCFNMYLIHNDSKREAHSYLLASRLSTLDNLLNSLHRIKPDRYSSKSIDSSSSSSNLKTISTEKVSLPGTPLTNTSLHISNSFINHPCDMKPEKCPDLLSSSQLKPQENLGKLSEMNDEKHLQKLPHFIASDPSNLKMNTIQDNNDSSEIFLTNFLCQLYTGNDPKRLLSKPDLLRQPEMMTEQSTHCNKINNDRNLLKLYNFLRFSSSISQSNKCLMSSDCELIFTCPSILSLKSISLPCHAGILACRSEFLRRLLLKRCKSINHNQSSIHKIVLDGTILPAHFSSVLLHFFYCDYLNLNEIANLLLIIDKQKILTKQHFDWHIEHYSNKNKDDNNSNIDYNYSCCKRIEDNQSPTITTPSSCTHAYSSYTESNSSPVSFFTLIQFLMNSSEFRVKHFCLKCPYCLTHIIQLHPIGAILEFPRLSEVCEDLLAEALGMPLAATSESWTGVSSCSNAHDATSLKMSPISLAVGLLKWIDEKSSTGSSSSPLSQSFSNLRSTMNSSTINQNVKSSDAFSSAMDNNQESFRPGDTNHQSSSYNGTSLGYVYRHALQCLQENFTSLVRSPSILRRLSPRQLRELLDSSLVQAPESEILAGLLCWAELQLKGDQESFFGVKSGHDNNKDNNTNNNGNTENTGENQPQDAVYLEYYSILTSLVDNSSLLNYDGHLSNALEENHFNHWLLLLSLCNNTNNNNSNDGIVEQHQQTTKKSTSSSLVDDSSYPEFCHLCQINNNNNNYKLPFIINEFKLINYNNFDKIINHQIGLIDLLSIIKLLNEHNLLELIQPAHILSPIPYELANLLLIHCYPAIIETGLHNTSINICNNDNHTKSDLINLKQYCENINSSWLCLAHAMKKSSQSVVCSDKKFSFEKLLSSPWSLSPAQFADKHHWASLLTTTTTTTTGQPVSNADEINCVCCWNKQRLTDNNNTTTLSFRKSWSGYSTNLWTTQLNQMKSNSKFSRPPRLYFAFLNEVRMLFIQKHALHHQKLHLMNHSNSLQSTQSECTCWEFLLSHRFDQSCNLSSMPKNISKSTSNTGTAIGQSSCDKYTKSFHQHTTSTTTANTTNPINCHNDNKRGDDAHDVSSECDLSFSNLAKKRFNTSKLNHDEKDNSFFFFNKTFEICCDYKCRDFAYCLLSSKQWTNIIDYYIRLVREYMNDPISHHPCTNNEYIHHIIRLRALWKYGLPDSLESLLLCRINEHMFMLQQPKEEYQHQHHHHQTITEYSNPVEVKPSSSSASSKPFSCMSTISLCTYSLPLMMNKLSCERYSEYINPSDINKNIVRTNSTVITTTPTVSRPICTLSSSTMNKMNISELNEKSDRIISVNQASESSCPICDNKVTSSPMSKRYASASENKSLHTGYQNNNSSSRSNSKKKHKKSVNTTQCIMYSCKDCENFVKSMKHNCHTNDLCLHCINSRDTTHVTTTTSTATTPTVAKANLTNVLAYPYGHRLCYNYSDSDYLLYSTLLSSNQATLLNRKINKSNCYDHYRYDEQGSRRRQHHHHSYYLRQQKCQSNIFYCPSEMTTLSSPCYRKVLFNCKDGEKGRSVYHQSSSSAYQCSPSSSSLSSMSVLNNTSHDSNHRTNISSKCKLSTRKSENIDHQNMLYSPLLLTLPCEDTMSQNISSSFTLKSNQSSDSTTYYSSSSSASSSSTSLSRSNSSPLSVASN